MKVKNCKHCSKDFVSGWDSNFCDAKCYIRANGPTIRGRLRKALEVVDLSNAEIQRRADLTSSTFYAMREGRHRGSYKNWKALQKVLRYPLLKKNDIYTELNARCEWCNEPFYSRLIYTRGSREPRNTRFCSSVCAGWHRASLPGFEDMLGQARKKAIASNKRKAEARAKERNGNGNSTQQALATPSTNQQVSSALFGLKPYEGEALLNWFVVHATADQLEQLAEEFPQIRKKLGN